MQYQVKYKWRGIYFLKFVACGYIYIYIKFIIIFYTIRVGGRGFFLIVKLSKDIWGCEAVHSELEPILLIKFFLSLILS